MIKLQRHVSGLRRQDPLARTLAAYWPIWEGAGSRVADVGRGKFRGIISGPTWTTYQRGIALDFTNDIVEIDTTGLTIGSGMTICAWVFPRNINDSTWLCGGDPSAEPGENDFAIRLNGSGNAEWNLWHNGNFTTGTAADTDMPAIQDVCQMVTYSLTATRCKGYFDGVKLVDVATTDVIRPPDIAYAIGNFVGGSSGIDGLIDQLILFGEALTDSEVATLAANPYRLITPASQTLAVTVAAAGFVPYPNPLLDSMTGGMLV